MQFPATSKKIILLCGVLLLANVRGQSSLAPAPVWAVAVTNHGIRNAAVTPNGNLLATGGGRDYAIRLWRTSDGSPYKTLTGHSNSIIGLAFSPDGSLLASVARDQNLKLWSMVDGREISTVPGVSGQFDTHSALTFSPDGTRLVTTLNGTNNLGIWRLADQQLLHALKGTGGGANVAAFTAEGKLLASAGGSRGQDTTVNIWNASDGSLVKTIVTSNTYGIDDLAFSPDGTILATGTDPLVNFAGSIELWDARTWSLLHHLPAKGHLLKFSPDGQILVSVRYGNYIDFWSPRTGALRHSFHEPFAQHGTIWSLSILPSGRQMILAGERLENGNFTGIVTSVHFPEMIFGARLQENGLKLEWTGPDAILQTRTDWKSPWANLEAIGNKGAALLPIDGPASFFRLISKEAR